MMILFLLLENDRFHGRYRRLKNKIIQYFNNNLKSVLNYDEHFKDIALVLSATRRTRDLINKEYPEY